MNPGKKTTFVKNEKIICDNVEVADTLNNYFLNAAKKIENLKKKFVAASLPQSVSGHLTFKCYT